MSIVTVPAGTLITLDTRDIRNIAWDWDLKNLRAGVTIISSEFTITVLRQSGATSLTKDNEIQLTATQATTAFDRPVAADNRGTQLRLNATTATLNDRYEVANKITTNETSGQTKEQSIEVLIQQRWR